MYAATKNWLRRNRTTLAISAGIVGAGYVAGQYILGKLSEARQRMSDDKIAREKSVSEDCHGCPSPFRMLTFQ